MPEYTKMAKKFAIANYLNEVNTSNVDELFENEDLQVWFDFDINEAKRYIVNFLDIDDCAIDRNFTCSNLEEIIELITEYPAYPTYLFEVFDMDDLFEDIGLIESNVQLKRFKIVIKNIKLKEIVQEKSLAETKSQFPLEKEE